MNNQSNTDNTLNHQKIEDEERVKAVRAMVDKEASMNRLKDHENHPIDRASSLFSIAKHAAREKYHEQKADREYKRMEQNCHQDGHLVEENPTTSVL